jgi:opacity protein-like surface antigen
MGNRFVITSWAAACAVFAMPLASAAYAAEVSGKLLATGGVSQVEGAGGGGLTPWALITGYGTVDEVGANLHATRLQTQDFRLQTVGVAVGVFDRLELSAAKQTFKGSLTPLAPLNFTIKQDVLGAKLRLAGDAVYAQDSWLPQIAVGVQVKDNQGIRGLEALGITGVTQLGAKKDSGVDVYVSASKILLAHSLLYNLTLRSTKANQLGILGYGGDKKNRNALMVEGSLAYLLNRKTALGVEYRSKPRNLSTDNEKDAADVFIAYFPSRNVSLTAAYVTLGDIISPATTNTQRQSGLYLSAQIGF